MQQTIEIDIDGIQRDINSKLKDLSYKMFKEASEKIHLQSELESLLGGVLTNATLPHNIANHIEWALTHAVDKAMKKSNIDNMVRSMLTELLCDKDFIIKIKEAIACKILDKVTE